VDKLEDILKILTNLQINLSTIVLAGCLLVAIFMGAQYCTTKNQLRDMAGRYEAYRQISVKVDQEKDKVISDQSKAIAESDQKIQALDQKVQASTKDLLAGDTKIADLNKKLSAAKDKDEQIIILKDTVLTMSIQVDMAKKIIGDQYTLIGEWKKKYNAQVEISGAWKEKYENQVRLNGEANKLLAAYQSKIVGLQLTGKVKTLAVVVAGGYIAYSTLKK
jgi:polyribonucleotide nucleotidyltransferase